MTPTDLAALCYLQELGFELHRSTYTLIFFKSEYYSTTRSVISWTHGCGGISYGGPPISYTWINLHVLQESTVSCSIDFRRYFLFLSGIEFSLPFYMLLVALCGDFQQEKNEAVSLCAQHGIGCFWRKWLPKRNIIKEKELWKYMHKWVSYIYKGNFKIWAYFILYILIIWKFLHSITIIWGSMEYGEHGFLISGNLSLNSTSLL